MWSKPTDIQLLKIPALNSTEAVETENKIIAMHFFLGGCDWYVCEYSPEERVFFGFAILNNDLEMAEWGYISLDELLEFNVRSIEVDRDLCWKPIRAGNVAKIKEAQGW